MDSNLAGTSLETGVLNPVLVLVPLQDRSIITQKILQLPTWTPILSQNVHLMPAGHRYVVSQLVIMHGQWEAVLIINVYIIYYIATL